MRRGCAARLSGAAERTAKPLPAQNHAARACRCTPSDAPGSPPGDAASSSPRSRWARRPSPPGTHDMMISLPVWLFCCEGAEVALMVGHSTPIACVLDTMAVMTGPPPDPAHADHLVASGRRLTEADGTVADCDLDNGVALFLVGGNRVPPRQLPAVWIVGDKPADATPPPQPEQPVHVPSPSTHRSPHERLKVLRAELHVGDRTKDLAKTRSLERVTSPRTRTDTKAGAAARYGVGSGELVEHLGSENQRLTAELKAVRFFKRVPMLFCPFLSAFRDSLSGHT